MQCQSNLKNRQIKHFSEHELLFMMGEELKRPLTNIKLLSDNQPELSTISLEARRALRTIDNLILYQQISSEQQSLKLEPVHIGSSLVDVISSLKPLGLEFGCETEVYIQSGVSAVDVDRIVLKSGLESMWQAMISMTSKPSPITWHIYKSPRGVRVAVLNKSVDLTRVKFSNIKDPIGSSRQPFAGIAGPATDLVTAINLFSLFGSRIEKIRKEGLQGIAVTLKSSPQLSFV